MNRVLTSPEELHTGWIAGDHQQRGSPMTGYPQDPSRPDEQQQDGLWLASPFSRRTLFLGAGTAAMAAALAACGGSDSSTDSGGSAGGTPKRGGDFRLGVTGGGAKDIMDGQNIITKPDQARLLTAWETLLTFDENYQLTTNGLAESVTQDNPKQFTIKLRQGIEFQDGKPFTADDVLYSFQRIGTKANGLTGYAATATMDIKNMKKVDKYTVQLPLKTPDSTVPQTLATYTFGMVPVGDNAYT